MGGIFEGREPAGSAFVSDLSGGSGNQGGTARGTTRAMARWVRRRGDGVVDQSHGWARRGDR